MEQRVDTERRPRTPWLVASALLLAGCMVGPDFQRPAAPLSSAWLEADDPAVDTSRVEYEDWWRVFDDPVLTRLVETAYAQNLTLRAAGVRVLEARARLGLAIGELFPQEQQLTAAASYNRIPISVPYDRISDTYWQAAIGAQAAWEIDLWGKIRRGIESADDAFLASVAEYDDVLVTLLGDVATAYVQIRTLEARRAIAEQNLVKQREALRIAESRYRNGVVSKRDVYQAQNVLGATEATIPALDIELRQAKNALAVLLGVPPGEADALLGEPGGEPQQRIPVAPREAAVGIPAELLPALTLVGNVGTVFSDIGRADLGDLFDGATLAYAAGRAVQWNVLNYGQITNNVRIQDARLQALLVEYQNAVLEAQEEVENGITVFLQSRRQADSLQASVDAALGALTVALNEYSARRRPGGRGGRSRQAPSGADQPDRECARRACRACFGHDLGRGRPLRPAGDDRRARRRPRRHQPAGRRERRGGEGTRMSGLSTLNVVTGALSFVLVLTWAHLARAAWRRVRARGTTFSLLGPSVTSTLTVIYFWSTLFAVIPSEVHDDPPPLLGALYGVLYGVNDVAAVIAVALFHHWPCFFPPS